MTAGKVSGVILVRVIAHASFAVGGYQILDKCLIIISHPFILGNFILKNLIISFQK